MCTHRTIKRKVSVWNTAQEVCTGWRVEMASSLAASEMASSAVRRRRWLRVPKEAEGYLWSLDIVEYRRQSKICFVRIHQLTHLQNIIPESGDSEKHWNYFFITQHLVDPHFATSFCFPHLNWVPFKNFYHVPLLSFQYRNFRRRGAEYPEGQNLWSVLKI